MWHFDISSNMNFPAPVAVLGFLAGAAGLFAAVLATPVLIFLRRTNWIRWIGVVAGTGGVVYFGLLFGFSLASHEVTLAPGQEKYFCEIDCHLAYSVRSTREELRTGERHVQVTVRTRFDETTISPRRPKDAPLSPNPRQVVLFDGQQRRFAPESVSGTALSHPLIPGESYETELLFRVPADATGLRLLIASPEWEERLLIGDENSFGHKKTLFAISAPNSRASRNAMPGFPSSFLHD